MSRFWKKSKEVESKQRKVAPAHRSTTGLAVIGLGSTAARFITWLVNADPGLQRVVLSIDGERTPEREAQEPWRISPADARDLRGLLEHAHLYPPMQQDPLLPQLNGHEVAKNLRQQSALKNIVLVAMTGYGQDSDREQSKEAGFDHHLVKPTDFGQLQEILAAVKAN